MTLPVESLFEMIRRFDLQLTASVDGPAEFHDDQRKLAAGTGSFDVVDRNVRVCRDQTGQLGALEAVYTPRHLEAGWSLVDLHRWIEDRYGGVRILIHPVACNATTRAALYSPEAWQRYEAAMQQLAMEYGLFLAYYALAHERVDWLQECQSAYLAPTHEDAYCECGVRSLAVGTDGAVYPCGVMSGFTLPTLSMSSRLSSKSAAC
jgi:sulfatase maturation enzyme AslB (radical SAM superfamily)